MIFEYYVSDSLGSADIRKIHSYINVVYNH